MAHDYVEAGIGLASNLFCGTGLGAGVSGAARQDVGRDRGPRAAVRPLPRRFAGTALRTSRRPRTLRASGADTTPLRTS
ncbi:hypothetical protein [Thiohalocapsa sp. ML1]|uniref:hypothetical protein n=1 Tax=Thiohalocapsa sp. ML1 TaxID=1431688 RepID=UPI0035271255